MSRAIVRRSTSTVLWSACKAAASAAADNAASGSSAEACVRTVAARMRLARSSCNCNLTRTAASLPMASSSGVPSKPMRNSALAFSSAMSASGAVVHPASAFSSLPAPSSGSSSASSASSGFSCARNGVPCVAGPESVGEKYCTDSICTAPCSMPRGTPVSGRRWPASAMLIGLSANSGQRCFRI